MEETERGNLQMGLKFHKNSEKSSENPGIIVLYWTF